MVLCVYHVGLERCIAAGRVHSLIHTGRSRPTTSVPRQPNAMASPGFTMASVSPSPYKIPPFFLLAVPHHSTGVNSQPTQQSSRRTQLSITTSKFQALLDQKQAVRIPPSTPIFQTAKQRWHPLPSPSRWSKLLRKTQKLPLQLLMLRPTSSHQLS